MTARKYLARIFSPILVLGGVAAAAGIDGQNRINRIVVHGGGQETIVEIQGERSPSFTTFKQIKPQQVVIDVAGATLGVVPETIPGDGKLIAGISAKQIGSPSSRISRVYIRLLKGAEYTVSIKGGSLFVRLTEGSGGVIASAAVPTWEGADSEAGGVQGRDLALAEELSAPGSQQAPEVGEEPGSEDEPADGREVEAPPPSQGSVTPPPPPVGVVGRTVDAPPPPAAAKETGPEPRAPAVARHDGGRVPVPPRPSPSSPILVAQAASGEDAVEEVEEVEEVPVEVTGQSEEAVPPPPPPAAAPKAEEAVPPPPPAATEAEEAPPPPPPVERTPAPPPANRAERVEISSAIKSMTWVGFQQTQESSRVFVKTNAPVRYRLYEEGDRLVVLELENTRIPLRNNRRFLDTHFFDTAVTMITPREIEGATASVRIEIELRNRVPFRATQEDNMVYVNFERPK